MNHYFYIDSQGKQKGTFSVEELKLENIRKETLVWTQGMEQWKPAGEVPELAQLFSFEPSVQDSYQTYSNADFNQTTNQKPAKPKTWLIESILVTVLPFMFCCNIFSLLGIIAIVKSMQVDTDYARGDYDSAMQSSKDARKWTLIVFWITIVLVLLAIAASIFAIFSIGSLA